MSDAEASLEFIAEHGSRVLEEIRLVREEQREQRLRRGSLKRITAQMAVEIPQVSLRLDRARSPGPHRASP